MLLAIDAGNTNTVFAICKEDRILSSWRCKTDSGRTSDEYACFLTSLFSSYDYTFKDIDSVIISSVVPELNFNLERFSNTYIGVAAYFVRAGETDFGLDILLDEPRAAGADRLINAVAVKTHYQTPAIVVDFGTSTNFDVIDENANHIGGALGVGLNLSLDALHKAASKLPKVDVKKPPKAIGKNTVDAMRSGLYWGYVGFINGMLEKLSGELPEKPTVIATGGLAHVFKEDINMLDTIDDDLTLKGLIEVYKRNA